MLTVDIVFSAQDDCSLCDVVKENIMKFKNEVNCYKCIFMFLNDLEYLFILLIKLENLPLHMVWFPFCLTFFSKAMICFLQNSCRSRPSHKVSGTWSKFPKLNKNK